VDKTNLLDGFSLLMPYNFLINKYITKITLIYFFCFHYIPLFIITFIFIILSISFLSSSIDTQDNTNYIVF